MKTSPRSGVPCTLQGIKSIEHLSTQRGKSSSLEQLCLLGPANIYSATEAYVDNMRTTQCGVFFQHSARVLNINRYSVTES